MAIPSVTQDGANDISGSAPASPMVNAGLSIFVIVTEGQNLPTSSGSMNEATSTWNCFAGTKGGAGVSCAGDLYVYGFWKYTNNFDFTALIGDSGNFTGFLHLRLASGTFDPNGSPIEAVAAGGNSVSGGASTREYTVPSLTTLGADRLVVGAIVDTVDTSNTLPGTGAFANANLSSLTEWGTIASSIGVHTSLSGGGGLTGFHGGKAAAGATGDTTITSSRTAFNSGNYGSIAFAVKPASTTRVKFKTGGSFATNKIVKYKSGGSFATKTLKVKSGGSFA